MDLSNPWHFEVDPFSDGEKALRYNLRGPVTGAWPRGKAPGFGPGIAGSNPAAPAEERVVGDRREDER